MNAGWHNSAARAARAARTGRRRALIGLFLACVCAVAAAACANPVPAHAAGQIRVLVMGKPTTNLPELRRQAAEVKRRIALLDDQVETVVERYNQARSNLNAISAQLAQTRLQLQRSQDELTHQQELLSTRLAQMYKMGTYTLLDVLLTTGNLSDAQTEISFFSLIARQDQLAQTRLLELVQTVHHLENVINRRREQALAVQTEVDQVRAEVQAQLAERQAILNNLDSRIRGLLARQARRDAIRAARQARQAGLDLSTLPGTPAQISLVRYALTFLGVNYVWGGADPSGFDCSGLVQYVFAHFGIALPHYAAAQAQMGSPVALSALEPGDLVFFGSPVPTGVHHVGIYAGHGLFIEAPHTGDVVRVSLLAGRFATAARRVPLP